MSGLLNKANFMRCLSPQGNFHATELESVEQCAREHHLDDKARHEAHQAQQGSGPMFDGMAMEDWRKRTFLENYLERRKMRGGQTFHNWEAVERDY